MKDEKTRIFLGILGLICLVAMPVSAADNVRNITTYSICREDLYKDQNEMPFLEKFMVQQSYDIFRFGGESIKNDEVGIQRMLQNFPEVLEEEQIRKNMKKYNLPKMFELVKKYFKKEYDFEENTIQLSNCYQKTINSYIYNNQKNPTFIHIDELFESTVLSFFITMFK